ncbi:MAG: hypothetical protein ACOH2P_01420 [Pseudomonas sp.]
MTVKSGLISCVAVCNLMMAAQVLAECAKPVLSDKFGFAVCKDWPASPDLTLTATSEHEPNPAFESSGPDGIYDLSLAVVSSSDSKPLASFHQASAFVSDAIAIEDLQLDTARYMLTPDLRAFGVRTTFKGSSRVNPLNETLLSLYVKEGDALRSVMDRLITYEFSGEWDGNCAGERYETLRTVEMTKTSSHGYADLIVKSVTTDLIGVGEAEACELKSTTHKPVLTTLRYDGNTYVLPQGLKGL